MAGTGPGDLFALASELLAAVKAAVATAPGGAIPDGCCRVVQGRPAYDCVPGIYVFVGQPAVADTYPLVPALQPGHRVGVQGMVELISMTATVLRCAAVQDDNGNPPTQAQEEQVAQFCLGDVWATWNYLKTLYRAQLLFDSPSHNREFFYDPAIPVPTSGGAAGWEIPFRVQLGGYTADIEEEA